VTPWHLYLAAVAVLAVLGLFWRFTVSPHAARSNRVRAMHWRVLFRLRPGKGFASLVELGLHWSRLAALHHGRRTRPSARWAARMVGRPEAYGVRLGRAQYGKRVFARQEDQTLILATQRTGKSGLLADRILAHPGAVLATSTRADLFEHTAPERAQLGPVDVFNPGRVGNLPSTFGWDIIGGCEQPGEAYLRADALVGPRHEDMGGDMAWWMGKASTALGALMHAAALTPGADLTDVWAWCNRHGDAMAGEALANHPAASPVLAAVFSEIKREGRSPDSIRLTMGKALAWLAVPEVRAMVTAPLAQEFDVASFALGCGTLYMIAPAGIGTLVAPLFRAFVDYVHREAALAGSCAPAGKLDPPMLLALDEVPVIVPVPLDVWLADSAGKGILIAAVCHGIGQLRERWGIHGAETIWATTGTKVFLPGIQDAATLKEISELCGTIPVPQGEGMVSGAVVPPEFIRTLPTWRALVISMNRSPVVVKFRPVWKRLRHRHILCRSRPPLPVLLSIQDRLAAVPVEPQAQSPQPTWPTVPTPNRASGMLPTLRLGPQDITE
jgi:type IV secretion system protein VirD4